MCVQFVLPAFNYQDTDLCQYSSDQIISFPTFPISDFVFPTELSQFCIPDIAYAPTEKTKITYYNKIFATYAPSKIEYVHPRSNLVLMVHPLLFALASPLHNSMYLSTLDFTPSLNLYEMYVIKLPQKLNI